MLGNEHYRRNFTGSRGNITFIWILQIKVCTCMNFQNNFIPKALSTLSKQIKLRFFLQINYLASWVTSLLGFEKYRQLSVSNSAVKNSHPGTSILKIDKNWPKSVPQLQLKVWPNFWSMWPSTMKFGTDLLHMHSNEIGTSDNYNFGQ